MFKYPKYIWLTYIWSNTKFGRKFVENTSKFVQNFIMVKKKISNDQELIQSDPTHRPQNQKGNNQTHESTTAHERHPRQTERTALSQTGGHSATHNSQNMSLT